MIVSSTYSLFNAKGFIKQAAHQQDIFAVKCTNYRSKSPSLSV
jgi:polyphosphate kinase